MKLSTDSKTDIVTHTAIVLSCFLILFFAFFFLYLPWVTNHNKIIKVPNLKGLSLNQAESALDAADLNYEISDSTFMTGVQGNTILSNFPKSGQNVKIGRKIYLTIASYSAPMVKLPNIIGRSISSAKNQLLSKGLVFGGEEKIAALEENTVLKVKVNGQEVEVGKDIPKGSSVVLLVGDGYGNQMIDAPSISGLPFDEAEVLLSGLGLRLGSVIYETSDQAEGTVIKQNPSSGSKIKNGSPINVWVSGQGTAAPVENENNIN